MNLYLLDVLVILRKHIYYCYLYSLCNLYREFVCQEFRTVLVYFLPFTTSLDETLSDGIKPHHGQLLDVVLELGYHSLLALIMR